ncbi:MAG: ribonuclease P protein component [Proteobacteria bacterium]|nr:ribonuclease P protein component [Pseudomonadota bacterium]
MRERAGPLRRSLRRPDYQRATGRGQRINSRHFLVFSLDRRDGGPARLGITVTRKVGNAVRRNRIKRLTREWFRASALDLGSLDLVLIAKRDIPSRLGLPELRTGLEPALRKLSEAD